MPAQDHNFGGTIEVKEGGAIVWRVSEMEFGNTLAKSGIQYAYRLYEQGDTASTFHLKLDQFGRDSVPARAEATGMKEKRVRNYPEDCYDRRFEITPRQQDIDAKEYTAFMVVKGYQVLKFEKTEHNVVMIGPMFRIAIGYYHKGVSSYKKTEAVTDYPRHLLKLSYSDEDIPAKVRQMFPGYTIQDIIDKLKKPPNSAKGWARFCTVIKGPKPAWEHIKKAVPSADAQGIAGGVHVDHLNGPGAYALMFKWPKQPITRGARSATEPVVPFKLGLAPWQEARE